MNRRRGRLLLVIVPIAAVALAALLLLALSLPDQLVVPAGGVYAGGTIIDGYGDRAFHSFVINLTSPMTLVGAWTSDAPAATYLNRLAFPLGPPPPTGCSVAYNVTLPPAEWALIFAYPEPANITVTQSIRLVPPQANAVVLSAATDYWAPSEMGTCPAT